MSLRLKVELLAILGIAAGVWWLHFVHHERELGAALVEAADARAVAAEKARQAEQLAHEKQTNEDAVHALQNERDRLAADLASRPVPAIRLCSAPSGGRGLPAATGTAGPAGQGTPAARSDAGLPTGATAGPDVGPQLLDIALVAERLAAQERALLAREKGLQ